jgi:hypothetical protein
MKPKKIAILHFNIIEKYPPVMNFIYDALEDNPDVQIFVFTTKNTTSYQTPTFPNTKIYRFGSVSKNPILRYTSYCWFNLMSAVVLLYYKIQFVTAFESLSVFPLWIRSKLIPSTNAHIHFHEYISEPERQLNSAYMQMLFKLEDNLLKKYNCSHTNEDRKFLFLQDKSFLKSEQVKVRPNLPPKSWWNQFGKYKTRSTGNKLKIVYLGACDKNTMYVQEVIDWLAKNPEKLELTIISQELNQETRKMIDDCQTTNVRLMPPIDYFELPTELVKYDVGLVMYKGHIPNFVFNVPNKVYEYLACGLKVYCSQELSSTANLKLKDVVLVNFKNLGAVV